MDLIHICTQGPKSMGGWTKKCLTKKKAPKKYLEFGQQRVFL